MMRTKIGLTRRRLLPASVALSTLVSAPAFAAGADTPSIAAAADLNAALPDVAALFTKQTGKPVSLIFGSSGAFTQQILNGAPFEVFLSADESYVEKLVAAGKTDGGGELYATGRIGLFLPKGSTIKASGDLRGLAPAIRDGTLIKFAIANPDHAPYGRAAKDALIKAGVWQAIEGRLVLGENIAQATQFATSGSTQGGIIPLSLALTRLVQAAGSFSLIPVDMYGPLRQRAVVLKNAGVTARAFFAFLRTPPARAVLSRYGFALPTEKN